MRKQLFVISFFALLWSGLSGQISTYPDFTNFETQTLCGTSCSGSCNPTGSWRNADQWGFAQAGTDWLVEDGATPSASTGPDIDHTVGTSLGKYMYVETSGCNNLTGFLVSDIYNFSALSAPQVSFWYHMYGATMGTMHFDVDTTGLGNWVLNVVPSWTDNNNIWQLRSISLSAYAGRPSVRLRIRAQTGTSFTSDMAVDDITVFEPAANDLNLYQVSAGGGCGNSTTTPVIVSLVNSGADTILPGTSIPLAFEINLVTVWDTLITSMAYASNDSFSYTFVNGFADLSGAGAVNITAWSAWALDSLAGNDTATVTTFGIPVITTYPYFENFEAGQNGWLISNNTSGTWAFGTPAKPVINSAGSGLNSFVTGGLTGTYLDNDNSWVEGPCFDFTNICDPVISLKVWWNAEFSWDGMNITISTDGGTTWNLVGAVGDPFNWYTDNTVAGNPGGFLSAWSGRNSTSNGSGTWVNARHRLVGAGGFPNVKIRINFGTDGSVVDEGVAFDDIHIFNGTDFGADQTICSPATINLNADHGNSIATYAWSTGASTSSITASTTGDYTVTITASGSCTVVETMYLLVIDGNTSLDLGSDTASCGGSFLLDAGNWPGCDYVWSTGDSTQTISVTSSGNYSAEITTPCGTFTDTVWVSINQNPVVDLGPDSSFCDMVILDAGAGSSYLWNTSDVTQTLTVTSSGPYSVVVTDFSGCTGTDSVNIIVNASPVVSLGPDSSICSGDNLTLDAGNAGASYLWSDNSTGQTLVVSAAGNYDVLVTDSMGCSASDSVAITVDPLPVADFNFTIGGVGTTYNFNDISTGSPTAWSWDFGDGGTSTSQNPAHTYASDGSYTVTLIVTNACGADTTTTSVTATDAQSAFMQFPVSLFPNPSDGNFTLRFEGNGTEVGIAITNLAGQVVLMQNLGELSGLVSKEMQLTGHAAGIYFVKISLGDQSQTLKLQLR